MSRLNREELRKQEERRNEELRRAELKEAFNEFDKVRWQKRVSKSENKTWLRGTKAGTGRQEQSSLNL